MQVGCARMGRTSKGPQFAFSRPLRTTSTEQRGFCVGAAGREGKETPARWGAQAKKLFPGGGSRSGARLPWRRLGMRMRRGRGACYLRAPKPPSWPACPPACLQGALTYLLDGRHGVPTLRRAGGEARGRGRLVVLMGLGHEFRHGDLVRHRHGAREPAASSSSSNSSSCNSSARGSGPAACKAKARRPASKQLSSLGPVDKGKSRGRRSGSLQGARVCSPFAGPGGLGWDWGEIRGRAQCHPGPARPARCAQGSSGSSTSLPERAIEPGRRTRSAGGNYPPASPEPRASPTERGAGPSRAGLGWGWEAVAGPGLQSARSPPPSPGR